MSEDTIDLNRITPLQMWYLRAGLNERTGRRLIREGKGPVLTRLTERRQGVREADYQAWLDSRRNK